MKQYAMGQGPRCLFGNMDRLSVGCFTPPYVSSPVAFDGGEFVFYSCHLCGHFYVSLDDFCKNERDCGGNPHLKEKQPPSYLSKLN